MKLLVLVVGAGGQLGDAMASLLPPRHEVVTRNRQELDITVPESVRTTVASVCPDVIVNCAAYTHVDRAQQEPVETLAANAWGVRTLARAAADIDAAFVHFSTDFVFDGETSSPYVEEDEPNPRGTYAISKLLGEWLAADAPRHYILRVESLFGGPHPHSSVDRLLDGILNGRPVGAFADRTVSPSYVEDVVAATAGLLSRSAPYGVYHCVSSGWTTWAGLARELARLAARPDARVEEVAMADAGLPTPRPRFAALSNAKLARLGIDMPPWQDALSRYVAARLGRTSETELQS
jgi:dTDP-4-dehydrorhamnose reductase